MSLKEHIALVTIYPMAYNLSESHSFIVNDSMTLFRIQHCRSSTQHISYFIFCSISPVWPRVVETNKLRLPFN
jgi:hypothetical protein